LKRLTAILFLSVLLFNLYGNQVVIYCLEKSSEVSLGHRVEREQYKDDELISVKTVLNLPYYAGSSTYERAYGSININGTEYEYVKRRVYQDTLELLCLPNHTKTQLAEVKNELTKMSAEAHAPLPGKKSNTTLKLVSLELMQPEQPFSLSQPLNLKEVYTSAPGALYCNQHVKQLERPPQPTQPITSWLSVVKDRVTAFA
jgi:hypothetical protein